MKTSNIISTLAFLGVIFLLLSGCGTSTGNGQITVETPSFSTSGFLSSLGVFSTNVSSLKLCVKKIVLKDENDESKKKDDDEEIEFAKGLVDLSSGAETSLGNVEVPVGFTLKRARIMLKKDPTLCGVDYSFKFNSFSSDKNIQLKWTFDPPIELSANDVIELSFSTLVSALRQAADNSSLSNSTLKDESEGHEGSARKKR